MRLIRRGAYEFLGLLAIGSVASAQSPGRTVQGIAFDSLHGRPLGLAFVTLVELRRSTTTDSAGRFQFDSIRPGSFRVTLQHDVIDAVGLGAVGTTITVGAASTPVVVAIPAFATLWRAACGSPAPPADSGFVFGTTKGEAGLTRPRKIVASWVDLDMEKSRGITQKGWKLETMSDSAGNFALCGLPTSTGISVRAADDSSDSGWLDVRPLGETRIARRDLVLARLAATTGTPASSSSIRGQVLSDSGRTPMEGAIVELPVLGLSTLTDAAGQYVINGVLVGTHLVTVKRIGYAPIDQRLEFSPSQTVHHDARLERITVLDSVSVTARVAPRDEGMRVFAENVKRGFGTFVTRADLEKRHGQKLSSVMAQVQGIFVLHGRGGQAWVAARRQPRPPRCISSYMTPTPRGQATDSRLGACARSAGFYLPDADEASMGMAVACYSLVFIDRAPMNMTKEPFDLNTVPIDQIEAIEWYSGVTQVPIDYARFRANCGVLAIHTRRHVAK